MSQIDIAKSYIKAAQTGDQALLASLVSPDVIWHQPGNNQFSGTHKGLPAVGAMLGRMMEVSRGTFALYGADHFMANGPWVAIRLSFKLTLAQAGHALARLASAWPGPLTGWPSRATHRP